MAQALFPRSPDPSRAPSPRAAEAPQPPQPLQPPQPPQPPAGALELCARLLVAAVLLALLYGLFAPGAALAVHRLDLSPLVLLRIALFALTAVGAALVQSARPSLRVLLPGALACGALALAGLYAGARPLASSLPAEWAALEGEWQPPAAWEWLTLESAVLAAALLGTALGRAVHAPAHLLVLLLCAASGDAWLSVQELAPATNPAHLLRLPWPPTAGNYHAAPFLTDLLFLCAYLEAARRLGVSAARVALGAAAAYALAASLTLYSRQNVPSLPLVSLGVLLGAWPRLRCSAWEVLRALACSLVLFALLLGVSALHKALHPRLKPRPEFVPPRALAQNTEEVYSRQYTVTAWASGLGSGSGV